MLQSHLDLLFLSDLPDPTRPTTATRDPLDILRSTFDKTGLLADFSPLSLSATSGLSQEKVAFWICKKTGCQAKLIKSP